MKKITYNMIFTESKFWHIMYIIISTKKGFNNMMIFLSDHDVRRLSPEFRAELLQLMFEKS